MWVIDIINWIKHNFWYKVLSLALSVALWMYVVNTYNPVIALDARAVVEVRNVPEGLQQISIDPSEIEVRLQGRSSHWGMATPTCGWWRTFPTSSWGLMRSSWRRWACPAESRSSMTRI